MTIKVKRSETGDKIIMQVGEFRVNQNYRLTNGYHQGKVITLTHISPCKQVMIDRVRNRFVCGELIEEGASINTVLESLEMI